MSTLGSLTVAPAELRRLATVVGGVANDVAGWHLDLYDAAYHSGDPGLAAAIRDFADHVASYRRELIEALSQAATDFLTSAAEYEANEAALVASYQPINRF